MAAGTASAGFISIDDFSVDQTVSDTTANGTAVTSVGPLRTMSSNMLTGLNPISNSVDVSFGILSIINGSGDDTEVKISWDLAAFAFPAGTSSFEFSAMVLGSDGNPTDVAFDLDGVSLLTGAIPANTTNLPISFGINPALITGGGILTMTLNGAAGWDLDVDTFGISFKDPAGQTQVSEPASLALFGLALAAAGVARRRQA